MFKIAALEPDQVETWAEVLETAVRGAERVQVAFDDLDQAIKVKIGGGPWSRPYFTSDAE